MRIRKFLSSEYFYIGIGVVIVLFLYRAYLENASDVFKGAFWGVFSAIIVGIVTFYAKRLIVLQGRRYNALVYCDMKLNTLLSTLNDNQFLIKRGVKTEGILLIIPHEITISENRIHEIGRISVKRKLVSLSLGLEKYNNSLRTAIVGFQGNIENLKLDPLGLSSKEKEKTTRGGAYPKRGLERKDKLDSQDIAYFQNSRGGK